MKVRRKNTRKIIKGKKPARRIRQKALFGATKREQLGNLWNDTLTMIGPVESMIATWKAWITESNKHITQFEVYFDVSQDDYFRNQMFQAKQITIMKQVQYKQEVSNEIKEKLQKIQAQLYNYVLPFKGLVQQELALFTGFNYDNERRSLRIEMYNLTDRLLKSEQTNEVVKTIRLMAKEKSRRDQYRTDYYHVKPEEKEMVFTYCVDFFNAISAKFSEINRIDGEKLTPILNEQIQQGQQIVSELTQIINYVDQLIQGINWSMGALISYHHELFSPLPATVNSEDKSVEAQSGLLAQRWSVG